MAPRFTSESFWARVDKSGECWIWQRAVDGSGYGHLIAHGKHWSAHRWAYISEVGPIPDGLELDHLCRVRRCVRPSHLEPVTHKVNCSRGIATGGYNRYKTHCPQGHAYTAENTYHRTNGNRHCRTCVILRERRKRAQRKAVLCG